MNTDELVCAAYTESVARTAEKPVSTQRGGSQYSFVLPVLARGLFFAGTAGNALPSIPPSPLMWKGNPTGANCNVEYSARGQRRVDIEDAQVDDHEPSALSIELASIQHHLGANISELAAILRVSRPTVYAWLRGSPDPHSSNLGRIHELHSVIQTLLRGSDVSLAKLIRRDTSRRSALYDLFSAPILDKLAIDELIAALRLSHRSIPQKLPLREVMRRHGIADRSAEAELTSLSEETGV
jgi:transcriptional regulator with XRE-family HTH domain